MYLNFSAQEMEAIKAVTESSTDLLASWKLIAGDVNFRAMHLFRYKEVRVCIFPHWYNVKR